MESTQLQNCQVLGEGAFGKVFSCVSKTLNILVARKQFVKRRHFEIEDRFYTLCETKKQHRYSCKIIRVLGRRSDRANNKYFLDLELGAHSMHNVTFNSDNVGSICPLLTTAASVREMVMDTIRGMCFLHEAVHILHNDLKPLNLLWFSDGSTKICDLGLCSTMSETRNFGTIGYCAPELYENFDMASTEEEKSKSDVFSLGVTLYKIIEGRPLVPVSKRMELAYKNWQRPTEHENRQNREENFQIYKAISREFFAEEFYPRLPTGLNVYALSYGVAHLVADMCIAQPAMRPSSASCIPRLRLLEQVEKALVGPFMPTKSTPLPAAAWSCLGTATAANAFQDMERPTAAETAALSARSFTGFAVPLPPPPAAAAAAAAPVIEVGTMATPILIQSPEPMGTKREPEVAPEPVSEYDILVELVEIEPLVLQGEPPAQQVEEVDILAIAIAEADPPLIDSIQPVDISRSQAATSNGDNLSATSISRMSPVTDNDCQRLKAIVQKVDDALSYSKKDPFADITTDEDREITRRLRKRGPHDLLNPIGKELLKLLYAKDAQYISRKRVFTLLTLRSSNYWKNGGPAQAIRNEINNNDV